MRDTHFLQTCQPVKSTFTHECNPFADIDLLQALGHVSGVGLVSARAKDIAEPSDLVILEGRADEGHRDLGEFLTILKGAYADDKIPIVGIGYSHRGKPVAHECIRSDVDQRFGCSVITAEARIGKGVIVNTLDLARFGHGYLGQLPTTVEGEIRDFHDAVGQHDVGQILTAVERTLVHALEIVVFGKDHLLEIIAHSKGIVVDRHHAGGNVHCGDTISIVERAVTEGQDIGIVKELDLRQLTVLKGAEADDLDTFRYGEATRPSRRYGNQLASILGN